jgi:hypothetical protein
VGIRDSDHGHQRHLLDSSSLRDRHRLHKQVGDRPRPSPPWVCVNPSMLGMQVWYSHDVKVIEGNGAQARLSQWIKYTTRRQCQRECGHHGLTATFRTPLSRSPNSRYPSPICSSEYVWVSSGVRSTRPCRIISINRRMRSFPPGHKVVTMR